MPTAAGADRRLIQTLASALLWSASFLFAVTFFFSAAKLLRPIPPPEPVAIGYVTVEDVSKPREYAQAALFYVLVPALTLLFRSGLGRMRERLARGVRGGASLASAAVFSIPFLLSPLLFLTTRREQWGILFPPILAAAAAWGHAQFHRRARVRRLFARYLGPWHALILLEAFAWILFRYIATGARIAHIPTLFLELPFAAFFLALFWAVCLGAAQAWAAIGRGSVGRNLAAIALGASPLVLLAPAALVPVDARLAATVLWGAAVAGILVALASGGTGAIERRASSGARGTIVFLLVPLLLVVIAWASSLHVTGWFDLFHRGESLGPASDYLRGDAPYRDVFVLHGLMEDGALDAWLMEIFGRSAEVSTTRLVLLGGLSVVALWLLAIALFDSIPLALLVVALGFVTFVENARALTETVVVAILFTALARRSRLGLGAAGAAAALALFYSLDIGLYSVAGSLVSIAIWSLLTSRRRRVAALAGDLAAFAAGAAAGGAPFLLWLAGRGALADFVRVSFVDVPRFIDPIWSLPFPDLAKFFVGDLHLRNVAEFLLSDRWRFILNPLVLGAGAVVLLARLKGSWKAASRQEPAPATEPAPADPDTSGPSRTDLALVVLAIFGVITQRSALGRADFQHQHFSAFLVAPLLVLLLALAARNAARHWAAGTSAARLALAMLGVAGTIALVSLLWIPDLLGNRLDAVTSYRARVRGAWHNPEAERVARRMREVVAAIHRLSPRSAPIWDFSNQPAFYFFADRPNPTRFFQIPIVSPPRFQKELIRDLEATRPPLVLRRSPDHLDRFDGLDNRDRAQAVAAYLDDRYRHEITVQGVELWRRRSDLRPVRSDAYLRHIHLPESATLAPPLRVVFPAAGSITGAAGSRWVSDLLVQNTGDDPLVLRMRYAGSRGSADRTVVVAPRRVFVQPDFPRALFDAGETVGALWVEHPADRQPILRMQTRDAARDSAPSTAEPLGAGDAATAGSARDEIRILGARGGEAIRLNVGAVNLGEGRARIRIRVSAADGGATGGQIEHALAEEQSWMLVDAGSRLEAALEPGAVVHLDVLEGTVAGWASIVDGISGRHEILRGIPVER